MLAGGTVGPLAADAQGAMPSVCARRRFDLGPQADAYHTLSLQVNTTGTWIAYLNGAQVAQSNGRGAQTSLAVPSGTLSPSGNILAIEVHPPAGTTDLRIEPVLDGQPDPAGTGAPRIVLGPYLVSPSLTGTTIVWETDQAVASQAIVDGKAYDGGSATHHQVRVTDLEASKSYPYHVEAGALKSEEAQLTTAAKPGERIRFVVYGDNRTDGDAHRRVVEQIEGEGPDFVINTGDLVDSSSSAEWDTFFNIEYSLIRRVPLFATIGNHETTGAQGASRFPILFPVDDRAANAGGQVYGADFGDVHLAALDSNGDLGAQGKWLDQDLTQAEARGAKHLFVYLHWGPFSSGTSAAHGSNGAARSAIVPVAKAHRVDAIFSGHDHFYERGASGTLPYFVTGGGGAPLDSAGRIAETLVTKSVHHYLVVDVAASQVDVVAKDLSGTPFDQLTLSR